MVIREKKILARVLKINKKNGVTTHFSAIFKLQFGKKKIHALLYILTIFRIIGCPRFPVWISNSLAKTCFFRIVINGAKILLYISRHCP